MEQNSLASTPSNQLMPKETISEFVKGAVEMETQIYTLEETIKKHQYERDSITSRSNQELNTAKLKFDTAKEKACSSEERSKNYSYQTYLKELKQHLKARSSGDKFGAFLGWSFVHYFFGAFISICLVITMWHVLELGVAFSVVFGILAGLSIWLTIFFKIRSSIRHKRYREEKLSCEDYHANMTKKLKDEENNLSAVTRKYNEDLSVVSRIDEQIAWLEQSLTELKNNLNIYYQKNIIPPDFRNLTCAILINYVFRNDQADTMREATLLCETHIRHTDAMKALKELSQTMRGIENTLYFIQNNIEDINTDIKNIASAQNKLISETKASRYATEALKSSAERIEWECYTRR